MVAKVGVGGEAPIVIQSMTNTDTEDVFATSMQVAQLARAGSDWCALPSIRARLLLPCREFASVWSK